MHSSKKEYSYPKRDRRNTHDTEDEEITSNVTDILTHIGSIGVYQVCIL